jgi:hypothetical protein
LNGSEAHEALSMGRRRRPIDYSYLKIILSLWHATVSNAMGSSCNQRLDDHHNEKHLRCKNSKQTYPIATKLRVFKK